MALSDEEARLGQQLVQAGQGLGSYLANILDDLPKDLIGFLAGDRIKLARAERLARGWENVKKRLEDNGVKNPEPPNLKYALPLLSEIADETSSELRDLWERLLAAAMNPDRQKYVRQSVIVAVGKMDPFDVLVLRAIAENGQAMWTPNGRDAIKARLQSSQDEVLTSFKNLESLDLIGFPATPPINPYMTALGNILMQAVR